MSDRLHVAVDANVLEAAWGGIPKHVHRVVSELVAGGDRVDLLVNLRQLGVAGPGRPGGAAAPARARALARPGRAALGAPAPARRAVGARDGPAAPDRRADRRDRPRPGAADLPRQQAAAVERQFRTAIPRSVRSATRVICVSEATAGEVASRWGVERTRRDRQRRGRPLRARRPARPSGAGRARRFGLDAPFVLHVGSLEPRKGLDVLIAAAAPRAGLAAGAGRAARPRRRADPRRRARGRAPRGCRTWTTTRWRASTGRPRPWPCRRSTRGSGSSRWRRWPAARRWSSPPDAGALGELAGDAAIRVTRAQRRGVGGGDRDRARAPRGAGRSRPGARRGHRWPQVAAAVRDVLADAARAR